MGPFSPPLCRRRACSSCQDVAAGDWVASWPPRQEHMFGLAPDIVWGRLQSGSGRDSHLLRVPDPTLVPTARQGHATPSAGDAPCGEHRHSRGREAAPGVAEGNSSTCSAGTWAKEGCPQYSVIQVVTRVTVPGPRKHVKTASQLSSPLWRTSRCRDP